MRRYEYGNQKILFETEGELEAQINALQCTKILHVVDDIPDYTTTKMCKRVYYETEIILYR